MDRIRNWVCHPQNSEFSQLCWCIIFGILGGMLGGGFLAYIIYTILYEIAYAWIAQRRLPYWRPLFRLGVISAGLCGWLLGRYLIYGTLQMNCN